jgi:signal transduction histidine kinase
LFAALFLGQPYLLLRLVGRFRRVPAAIRWFAVGVACLGAVVMGQPAAGSTAGLVLVATYFVVMLSYSAWAFGQEATKAAGVSATRLRFTAVGTWLHVGIAVLYGLDAIGTPLTAELPVLSRLLGVVMFACYYAGLVGPRYLRTAWARRALYDHFRAATLRPLEDRVASAATDLQAAAGRVVASDARAVLFFDAGSTDVLVSRATSPGHDTELRVRPAGGLVGRAIERRSAVVDRPSLCEPNLSEWAAPIGSQVIVVPIPGPALSWGLLVVVQRYGSLFPEDDTELLELLARLTGLTLEHGRLVVVERETERQAFQDRLTQVQKLQAFGQLASGTAHDFSNLLTAVFGYLHVIESHPRYDHALDDALAGIKTITERATELTSRLIALSRRESTDRRVVDVSVVVADLLPVLERVLETSIRINVTAAPGPVLVLADPVQLGQILINLALNARDAMPAGGLLTIAVTRVDLDGERQIGSGVLKAGGYARLVVSDTGVGMDAVTRGRIFEPFFTTKAPDRGTGLGLPTVAGIVGEMGGAIGVDSALGFGATFDVYLPVTAGEAPVTAPAAATVHWLDDWRRLS